MEAGPAGQADVDKRASLPVGPMGFSLEAPSEPREGAPRQARGAGEPQEANGPCSGSSLPPKEQWSLGSGTTAEAKGGDVVEVVWEGLRGPQECAMGATSPELEARVEQVVLEAIGDRQGPGTPETPAWVREDGGVVEVVWEGLGGTEPEALEDAAGGDLGLRERLGSPGSRDRECDRDRVPGSDEGSFIWVERVTVSEGWEELLMEGLEGPLGNGGEAGVKGLPGTDGGGEGATWDVERRRVEEKGAQERLGTDRDGADGPLEGTQTGSQASSQPEATAAEQREGPDQDLGVKRQGVEGPLRAERGPREKLVEMETPPGVDEEGGEERGKEKEEPLGSERVGEEGALGAEGGGGEERGEEAEEGEQVGREEKGGEGEPGVAEEPMVTERTGSEEPEATERTGSEEPEVTERTGNAEPEVTERKEGEEPLRGEETHGAQDLQNGAEQREAGEGRESQAEEGSEAGAPLKVTQELAPEKQEGALEEEAGVLQPPAEAQDLPLLAEAPAPDQPTESQPLLPREGPSSNPRAHPAPTYAPTRQPEPTSHAEGEEASGPKQKTCQCCAVM